MSPISPKASMILNLGIVVIGGALAYLSTNALPAPVSPETAHQIQAWSAWVGGFGAAGVAAFNSYLHSVSSAASGPLAK